jgi:hypothetical protein
MRVMSIKLPNLGNRGICLINSDLDNGNIKVLGRRMGVCVLSQKRLIIARHAHSRDMDLDVGSDNLGEFVARLAFPVPVGITMGNLKEFFAGHCESRRDESREFGRGRGRAVG